jgi:hypothetical protein
MSRKIRLPSLNIWVGSGDFLKLFIAVYHSCSRHGQDQVLTHGIHGLFLTCGKINTCCYMDNSNARIYMGKGSGGYFLSSGWLLHYNIIVVLFGMLLIDALQQG